jgi:diguanylate cyclase (GGDEF)-like protein
MRQLRSFWVDSDNVPLMRAQMAAFSKQVPLLYFILCVNAAALAFAYRDLAPSVLTVGVSTALISLCVLRLVVWTRSRNKPLSDRAIAKRLKATVILGAVIGVAFLAWAVALFPYGTDRAQDQATFFVGITVISCIFCLMHLRAAALLLTGIIVVPFTFFLVSTRDSNLISIAVNLFLVSTAMIYVLVVASRDFASLISSQIETRRLSDENARLANIDSLTGLPSRRQFFSELDGTLAKAHASQNCFFVGVIDLDGFKPVNDRFGHIIGDHVLTQVGARLCALSDETTFVARIGGDEFAIILDGERSEAELVAFGEQVCAALRVPYEVLGIVANISATMGFAAFPEAAATAKLLYERADYALYHAKKHQRGRAVIFSTAHEVEIRNTSAAEQCLRNADLEAEITLDFQPVYDVSSNRPVAFEALARWNSPELGPVSPSLFIPIAERIDLINRITQILLRKALVAASTWPSDIHLSFNLSARDIGSPEAMLNILTIVQNGPIAPNRIEIEVTETSVVADFEQARTSLFLLRSLGVGISLDDFGTGYSSLSHVHRLPLDKVKVDRSFVQDIETQQGQSLIKSVINLCENLQIGCVIEGMETANQAQILRGLGCTTMQGYFFGMPVPQDEVLEVIARAPSATGAQRSG